MLRLGYCLCLATAAVLAAQPAMGDVVYFANGDRLTGTLRHIHEGLLYFETDLLGAVEIPVEQAAGVDTAGPVTVRAVDGGMWQGALVYDETGQTLVQRGEPVPFPLAMMEAVTPDPEALAALDAPELPAADEAEQPKRWKGAVEAGARWRSGSTDALDVNLGVNAVREWPGNALTLTADWAYGEVSSQINTRRLAGSARWQHYWSGRSYTYLLGGLEHDPGRKLELRAEGAFGAGYDFINRPERKLAADLGLNYALEYWTPYDITGYERAKEQRREALRGQAEALARDVTRGAIGPATFQRARDLFEAYYFGGVDNSSSKMDRVNLRIGALYEQQVFERGRLTEELTVFPDLTNAGEVRVTSKLSFVTPLAEQLNLRLTLRTDYDSKTAVEREDRFDNTFLANLAYEF